MKLGAEVGLGPGHIVLDENPAPSPKWGTAGQFSAHVRCGQTAGWIKMLLGMEVGLVPGDFVLDGDPARSPKKGHNPQFSAHVLWPNGWMDQDATWYGGLKDGFCGGMYTKRARSFVGEKWKANW